MKKLIDKIPRDVAPLLHLGWSIAFLVTGFSLLGVYLDKRFNTSPIAAACCSLLGILSSGYIFFSTISKLPNPRKKNKTMSKKT